MAKFNDFDDPRREWLIRALATGLLTAGGGSAWAQGVFGKKPAKLPEGQSIFSVTGDVKVNNQPATQSTPIKPGDTVQTGTNGQAIFAVGGNAMILRNGSTLVIQQAQMAQETKLASLIGGLQLLTGKLLSVSRNSPMTVRTATATIGIRGTGFYIESDPEKTYFCTCYGSTEVEATNDPESRESVVATHHERPLYIVNDGGTGRNIRDAPFINHTDQELALVEAIVGRKTPFVFGKDAYGGPRRTY